MGRPLGGTSVNPIGERTNNAKPDKPATEGRANRPEKLESELRTLREELRTLRSKVGELEESRVLEASDAIVLASGRAETIADAALESLVQLTLGSQKDPLTETPNRLIFLDRVERAIALARRSGIHFAVLFLDIDHFKKINVSYGHGVGDDVLRRVANALRSALRETDTVSRLGGDEFVVLLHAVEHRQAAAGTARLLRRLVHQPFMVEGQQIRIRVSLGIAMYPEDGANAADLIAHADASMYDAKDKVRATDQKDSQDAGTLQPYPSRNRGRRGRRGRRVDAAPAAVLLDPSDLREANQRLVIAALAAEQQESEAVQSYRRQARSIAIVAHELRVPLHPLRMAAAVLSRATASEAMLDDIKLIIDRQVTYMARLVEDLVDGSRIDAGTLRLERTRLNFAELVESALETCRTLWEEREQQLTVDLPEAPVYVDGDPLRLTQVVVNLLDNASKYSHRKGNIGVQLREDDGEARLTVTDDGIGIAATALPSIFDFFVQEPSAHAHAHSSGGLGIGLGVVRELVLAHGGHTRAASEGPGRGAEFVVTLPLSAPGPDSGSRPA